MKNNHLHTYRRIDGRKDWYMCTDPDCSHIRHKPLLIGKRAKCPRCGEPFIITSYDLKFKTPCCQFCHNSVKSEGLRKIRDRVNKGITNVGGISELLGFIPPKDSPMDKLILSKHRDAIEVEINSPELLSSEEEVIEEEEELTLLFRKSKVNEEENV